MLAIPIHRFFIALALGAALLGFALLGADGPTYASDGASGVTPHCGDASGDGIVNSIDAAIVLQYTAHLAQLHVPEAQVDPDGSYHVDSLDVLLILQAAAHRFHVRDFRCPM